MVPKIDLLATLQSLDVAAWHIASIVMAMTAAERALRPRRWYHF